MAIFSLLVGLGSLHYFVARYHLNISTETISEFNRRTPGVLRRVFGTLDKADVERYAEGKLSGVFMIVSASAICASVIAIQVTELFRYGSAMPNESSYVMVPLGILTLASMFFTMAYMLNMGRTLVKIEKARRDAHR